MLFKCAKHAKLKLTIIMSFVSCIFVRIHYFKGNGHNSQCVNLFRSLNGKVYMR